MTQNVLLFGGTGRTGTHIARLLAARGDNVTAMARPQSDTSHLEASGVTVFPGTPLSADDVNSAFDSTNFTTVISTLGHRRGEPPPRADLAGIDLIIAAAKARGIQRMLMITMIGAGDSIEVVSEKVIQFLGEPIKAKTAAEDNLRDSGLDYTILRPGGLNEGPETGTGIMVEECTMGVISTGDLARLTLLSLDDDGTIGKTLHTIDPEIKEQAPLQRGDDLPASRD